MLTSDIVQKNLNLANLSSEIQISLSAIVPFNFKTFDVISTVEIHYEYKNQPIGTKELT